MVSNFYNHYKHQNHFNSKNFITNSYHLHHKKILYYLKKNLSEPGEQRHFYHINLNYYYKEECHPRKQQEAEQNHFYYCYLGLFNFNSKSHLVPVKIISYKIHFISNNLYNCYLQKYDHFLDLGRRLLLIIFLNINNLPNPIYYLLIITHLKNYYSRYPYSGKHHFHRHLPDSFFILKALMNLKHLLNHYFLSNFNIYFHYFVN